MSKSDGDSSSESVDVIKPSIKKTRNVVKMTIGDGTPTMEREPTPIKEQSSKLSEIFNKEVAHNIPGVLYNIIVELIKGVEDNRYEIKCTNAKLENQERYLVSKSADLHDKMKKMSHQLTEQMYSSQDLIYSKIQLEKDK